MCGERALRMGAVAALLFCNLDITWAIAAETGGRSCMCGCCTGELLPSGVCSTPFFYRGQLEMNYAQCTENTLSGTEYCYAKCQEKMENLCGKGPGRVTGSCDRTALPQSVIDEIRKNLREQIKKREEQQGLPTVPK
jgi:hypothetical protein